MIPGQSMNINVLFYRIISFIYVLFVDKNTQFYKLLYTTWLLCAFSLVVDSDLLKEHTQRWASNPRQITSADLFVVCHALKTFNKPFEYL